MTRVQAFNTAGDVMEPTKGPSIVILREESLIEMNLFLPSLSLAKTLDQDLVERKHTTAKGKVLSGSFLRKKTNEFS